MARGWESKAVADQIDQADIRATAEVGRHEVSPVIRARLERLESLRLSHARTAAQLERAANQTHREMLRRTLQALEAEIVELS